VAIEAETPENTVQESPAEHEDTPDEIPIALPKETVAEEVTLL
jgi:hypothetical protein